MDTATTSAINTDLLPMPYLVADLVSKKNYLGLFIEHETSLSDRLSINFEGTLDIAIADTTDLPEIPLVEPVENHNFYPEIGLDYQLSDRIWLFASFDYAAEPMTGTDAKNELLQSEIYRGIELGIETELSNNWLATVSFTRESQNHITTIDPNNSDFDLQIDRQISQSWTGELRGEITPNWWLYGFYTYTDAQVIADRNIPIGNLVAGVAPHRGGFWTSYQISEGTWRGLGFGGGIVIQSDRPGDAQNSFYFPSCLQTDLAIFYTQNNFKAAISLQNIFDAGVEDEEITPQTIIGTALWEF
ncbi:ferrichrome iron receptor [Stanieria sp. NIES-3757]|nr:ferrichrome iron receptor [Stanieria sp. NIES-3757]